MKKFNLLPLSFCFLLFLIIAGTFSCKKSSSDNSGSIINAGGSWTGTVSQAADGTQPAETDNITMSLSQSGTNITGAFTKNGSTPSTGTVSGTINGGSISLTCNSATTSGGAVLKGTINSAGNSMSGTFTSLNGTDEGTWSLTRN